MRPQRRTAPLPLPGDWTAADAAELNVLLNEFVNGCFEHYERCGVCSQQARQWCPGVRAALEVILDWRVARSLRSTAEKLRAEEHGRQAA